VQRARPFPLRALTPRSHNAIVTRTRCARAPQTQKLRTGRGDSTVKSGLRFGTADASTDSIEVGDA